MNQVRADLLRRGGQCRDFPDPARRIEPRDRDVVSHRKPLRGQCVVHEEMEHRLVVHEGQGVIRLSV